jgi:hypothetical protein
MNIDANVKIHGTLDKKMVKQNQLVQMVGILKNMVLDLMFGK